MKVINYIWGILAMLAISSCGGGNENATPYKDGNVAAALSDDNTEVVAAEEVAEADVVAPESESSGEDWDTILDKYEQYCNKVVAIAKKVKAGDVSAMTEYASALESAEELQKKLDNAKNDMTAAQAARLSKIAAKMSSAMM